jgi:hypothetical protein
MTLSSSQPSGVQLSRGPLISSDAPTRSQASILETALYRRMARAGGPTATRSPRTLAHRARTLMRWLFSVRPSRRRSRRYQSAIPVWSTGRRSARSRRRRRRSRGAIGSARWAFLPVVSLTSGWIASIVARSISWSRRRTGREQTRSSRTSTTSGRDPRCRSRRDEQSQMSVGQVPSLARTARPLFRSSSTAAVRSMSESSPPGRGVRPPRRCDR